MLEAETLPDSGEDFLYPDAQAQTLLFSQELIPPPPPSRRRQPVVTITQTAEGVLGAVAAKRSEPEGGPDPKKAKMDDMTSISAQLQAIAAQLTMLPVLTSNMAGLKQKQDLIEQKVNHFEKSVDDQISSIAVRLAEAENQLKVGSGKSSTTSSAGGGDNGGTGAAPKPK